MPNDGFLKDLANKSLKPKPGSHLDQMLAGWRETYPIGALRKVIKKVIDPIKDQELPIGALVTIKSYDVPDIREGPKWIVCEDSNKETWNVPRTYLMKISTENEKKGRFRILAQDAEMEKLLIKEQS